jgi:predicted GNAT family acetyltransferase
MAWTLTGSLDSYAQTAGAFLRSRPVHHTIQLTAIESLRVRGDSAFGEVAPLFGWWRSAGGEVTVALLHTPPFPVLLTRLPEHSAQAVAGALAGSLAASGRQLAGVNAAAGDGAAFAAAWSGLTGSRWQEFRRSRLYRLGQFEPPAPVPAGAARVATAADRDLLESWVRAFVAEIDDLGGPGPGMVDDRLSYGGLALWETAQAGEAGGGAVSMAGAQRPVAGVVRLGPVYTPPEHRGRGYGAAVTAAVSQAALGAGASDVVLFTDVANAASNALYQRLGYRPVMDLTVLRFVP